VIGLALPLLAAGVRLRLRSRRRVMLRAFMQ
jgi:putative transposase